MHLFIKIEWNAVSFFFLDIFRQIISIFSLFVFLTSFSYLLASLLHCFVALVLAVQFFVHLSIPSSCSLNINSKSIKDEIEKSDCKNAKQYLIKTKPTCLNKYNHDVSTAVLKIFDTHFWNTADIWYATKLQLDGNQMRYIKNTVFAAFNQKELMKNDNFSTNKTYNKYMNLIIWFETDFCFYFVKNVSNFNKGIIWKLLSKLKKAYIKKQK